MIIDKGSLWGRIAIRKVERIRDDKLNNRLNDYDRVIKEELLNGISKIALSVFGNDLRG